MDSKLARVMKGLCTFAMDKDQEIPTSRLLSMPLEIREMIWAHAVVGPEIALIEVEDSDKGGSIWKTRRVTRQKYKDLYPGARVLSETSTATHNIPIYIATTSTPTSGSRFLTAAHVIRGYIAILTYVTWLIGLAMGVLQGHLTRFEGFLLFNFLVIFFVVATLAFHQLDCRRPTWERHGVCIEIRLHKTAEVIAKTVHWLRRQLAIGNRPDTPSDTTISLLLVNMQINREVKLVLQRSHCYALSHSVLSKLSEEDLAMSPQQCENIRSVILPPLVANRHADLQGLRSILPRITRALPNVRSVEIRIKFVGLIKSTPAGPSFRVYQEGEKDENDMWKWTSTEERLTWAPYFFEPLRAWNLTHAIVSVEAADGAIWGSNAAHKDSNLQGMRFRRHVQRAMLNKKLWLQHLIAEHSAFSKQLCKNCKKKRQPLLTLRVAYVLDKQREVLERSLRDIHDLVGTACKRKRVDVFV